MATVAIFGIEIRLEGEDTKNLVAVLSNSMDAPLFPCPYLGWDIIDNAGIGQVLFAELGHTQVEGRIVDEDEHIGLLVEERKFGNAEITLDLAEILQDGQDTHICHVAVVHAYVASLGSHLISP